MPNKFKSVLIVGLAIACVVIASHAHSEGDQIVTLKRKVVQLDRDAARAQFEMASKCSQEARRQFEYQGYKIDAQDTFTDHYNPQLNRCFIEIDSGGLYKGVPTETKFLADALEGKILGNYNWMNLQGKQFWEVKPYRCSVTTLSGEEKSCNSEQEFDTLAAQYMR